MLKLVIGIIKSLFKKNKTIIININNKSDSNIIINFFLIIWLT